MSNDWIDFRLPTNVIPYRHFRVLKGAVGYMSIGALAQVIADQICGSPALSTDQKLGIRMIQKYFEHFDSGDDTVNYVLQYILYRNFTEAGAIEATPMSNLQREAVLGLTNSAAKSVVYQHIIALQELYNLQCPIPIWRKPDKPLNLAAVAASSTQIDLTWTDPGTQEEHNIVARSTVQGGPYTDIATLDPGSVSYSDTTCLPSTTYYYTVRGTNTAYGDSDQSTEANATTPAS